MTRPASATHTPEARPDTAPGPHGADSSASADDARDPHRVAVKGRDVAQEAYRIETRSGTALVPECLMQSLRPGERPSHQEAYEWIAKHRKALSHATECLARGETPRRPYDLITLTWRNPASSPV